MVIVDTDLNINEIEFLSINLLFIAFPVTILFNSNPFIHLCFCGTLR